MPQTLSSSNRYPKTIKNDSSNNAKFTQNFEEKSISGAGVSTKTRHNVDMIALSIPQAAQSLGISRSLLYKLLERQIIRSFHIGGRHLISVAAIDEFIKAQEEANSYGW